MLYYGTVKVVMMAKLCKWRIISLISLISH